MRRILITGFAAFAGLTVWTIPAGGGFLSKTGPVIAILAGELFVGEAEGHLNGSGTIRIESRAKSDVTCSGKFTFSRDRGDAGDMQCSDGATATFQFQRLSLVRGYGSGSTSRGPMSFTYGLSAVESLPFLKLPAGKTLRPRGNDLLLADVGPSSPAILAPKGPIARVPDTAPDVLLSAATLVVIARLKQDRALQIGSPGTIAELVEATILPLFDFRHMTQLAVATNWRLASPEQQDALIAGFRSLLVRSYSVVLASYRDQAIEYQPTRMVPGETWLTVKSIVKQPGAERMTIDYDMEKTTAGWKVYDIKVAGVSLITTYRSTFAQTIHDGGVDGLIKAFSAKTGSPTPESGSAKTARGCYLPARG